MFKTRLHENSSRSIHNKHGRVFNRENLNEARQTLFTKAVENAIKKYPLGSQEGKGENAKVIARFFGGSSYTCYVLEGDLETGELFCLASLGYGFEYGYNSRQELERVKFRPFKLPLERDISVVPLKYTLGQCMKMYGEQM